MTPYELGLGPGAYYYEPYNFKKIHVIGSIVKVKKEYIDANSTEDKRIYDYYKFIGVALDNTYEFVKIELQNKTYDYDELIRFNKCEYMLKIERLKLDSFIDSYIKDISYDVDEIKFKFQRKDWEVEGLMTAWAVFIVIFIVTFIFNDAWIFQIIELFIFNSIRKEIRKDND